MKFLTFIISLPVTAILVSYSVVLLDYIITKPKEALKSPDVYLAALFMSIGDFGMFYYYYLLYHEFIG